VHEAVQVGGFGAEIAATVAEERWSRLKAPVSRLGAPRIPIGYAPSLEDQVRIMAERDIVPAIQSLVRNF
jgi:pyruvate dehydrogenase E1 component beta subunit